MNSTQKLSVGDRFRFIHDGSIWEVVDIDRTLLPAIVVAKDSPCRLVGRLGALTSWGAPDFLDWWEPLSVSVTKTPVAEAPCKTCGKKNDVGCAKCWWCEGRLQ